MGDSTDLTLLRSILEHHFAEVSVQVYLFGSAARGTLRRDSDLDIGVLPTAPLPLGLLADLRERLETSNLLYRVDVVDLSQAPSEFVARVMTEGVRWIG